MLRPAFLAVIATAAALTQSIAAEPHVPVSVHEALEKVIPGITPDSISATPVPGLYEVVLSTRVVYISADGNYVVFDTSTPVLPEDADLTWDVYAQWWSEPVIDGVTPSDLPLDAKTDITISGSGFRPGSWVYTTFVNGADGLEFSDVTVVDSSTITATISVDPGVALGTKLLSVQGLGTADGPLSGAYNNCLCLDVVP